MTLEFSGSFNTKRLLKYALPSIVMMVFTSIYSVVDGFFVSNFVGKTPFAAVNLIMPYLMILGCVGFMFGTGGSALIGKHLGMGEEKRANAIFSLLIYLLIASGVVLGAVGFAFAEPVARALGASQAMLADCVTYCRISMASLAFYMLQFAFQILLVTAERPKMAMGVTIAAGCTNMVLDYVFVGLFGWGVAGAAGATVTSEIVGGIIPLIYFFLPNSSRLRLGRTHWDGRAVFQACTNGASELMTNISTSVVSMLYNFELMRLAGQTGVVAYGVIMYANFIFIGVYMGFSVGIAPVISFHYGAGNHGELRNLFKRCVILIAAASVLLTAAAEISAGELSAIFVGYNAHLLAVTTAGFRIFSISFLIMGFNIFGSSLFTALNNGGVSALISFGRTLVFQVAAILTLPRLFGLNGVWSAVIAAEAAGLVLTTVCVMKNREKYHYLPEKG